MTLLSRYMTPSKSLIKLYETWLLKCRKKDYFTSLDRYIWTVIVNMSILRDVAAPEKGLYVCWPPSVAEISALDAGKGVKIKVVYPNGDTKEYEADEAATVESFMADKVFSHDKLFKSYGEKQFYWLYSKEQDFSHFPMPYSREKKMLKLVYQAEKLYESMAEEEQNHGNYDNLRRATTAIKKSKLSKQSSSSVVLAPFQMIVRIRKRIFSSLHSMPNFKSLNREALNFLFHQIKSDYIEFEVLKQPTLTLDYASHLAALCLQVKRYKKILTSKDNSLKKEEISKNMDFCVPYSLQKDKQQWESKIMQCFEQLNIKDLTIEEAQEQFLTLISSFRNTFGSYFIVRRKRSRQGLFNLKKNPINGIGPQLQTSNITGLRQIQASKVNAKQARKHSKFANSDSSNDDDDSSSNSGSSAPSQDKSSIKSDSDVGEDSKPSTKLDISSVSGYSIFEQNAEVIDDLFPSITAEILLIVTYEMIIFVDNNRRDKNLLEVKHEDLLYVMGKKDILKLAFQLNQNVLDKQKTQGLGAKGRRAANQTNENYQQDTIDVKIVLFSPNARVIAEDIIGNIQVNLVEKTKGKDYIEVMKPQFMDILAQDDFERRNMNDHDAEQQSKQMQILVDDNLLKGITNFKRADAKQLKEMGTKTALQMEQQQSATTSKSIDHTSTGNTDVGNDSDELSDNSDRNERNYDSFGNRNKMTPAEKYAQKLAKRAGFQFKLKKPDFMVYTRKHPTYTMSSNADNSMMSKKLNVSGALGSQQVKQSVVLARETISGTSFALENHTIDEEEEEISEHGLSPVSRNTSSKKSHPSAYASVPKPINLGKIDEESFDDGKVDTASAKNPIRSPIAKEEKRLDTQSDQPIKTQTEATKLESMPENEKKPSPKQYASQALPVKNVPGAPSAETSSLKTSSGLQDSILYKSFSRPLPGAESSPVKAKQPPLPPPVQKVVPPAPPAPPAPFDFKSFMGNSNQQNTDNSMKDNEAEKAKKAVAQAFKEVKPVHSANIFEKQGKDSLKGNMAKLLGGIPPPP